MRCNFGEWLCFNSLTEEFLVKFDDNAHTILTISVYLCNHA